MNKNQKLILEEIINLIKRAEKKYRNGNYKGAIEDKRKVQRILNEKSLEEEFLKIYRKELSLLYISKFDLIFDHKLRLDQSRKDKIIKFLVQKSEEKYEKGDFKAAIKALRRSEKYI